MAFSPRPARSRGRSLPPLRLPSQGRSPTQESFSPGFYDSPRSVRGSLDFERSLPSSPSTATRTPRLSKREQLAQRETGWVSSSSPAPIPLYSAVEDANLYRYFMENHNARKLLDAGRLTEIRNRLRASELRYEHQRSYGRPGSMSGSRSFSTESPRPLEPGSTRSTPLPQFAHQHHFGWGDAYVAEVPTREAARRNGMALETCDRIGPAVRAIQAVPVLPARARTALVVDDRCLTKGNCSLSLL